MQEEKKRDKYRGGKRKPKITIFMAREEAAAHNI
jgi:hypothetical protein